jgi:hypothetical protein
VHQGKRPWPKQHRQKVYAAYLQAIKEHPEQTQELLRKAKDDLSNGSFERLKRELSVLAIPHITSLALPCRSQNNYQLMLMPLGLQHT